jgi:hypothetical protein
MKELVSVTGAATKISTETEHKTKLKLTTDPVFETLCTKKSKYKKMFKLLVSLFVVYHREKY